MAYSHVNSKGDTYYLHGRDVALRSGKSQKIFYFSKMVQPGALHVLPTGKIVVENEKTGLPILKTSDGYKPEKQPIGSAEVLNGEKIRITEKKILEAGSREVENNMNGEEMESVQNESRNGVENMNGTHEAASAENAMENSTETTGRRNIKIDPIDIALLPGQLLVIAAAKWAMRAWENYKQNQKAAEAEDEEI